MDELWAGDDQAKLNLEIRLYDHLPFGPQFHIDKETFVGFFVVNASSITAPMVRFHENAGSGLSVFREDYEADWRHVTPVEILVASPPRVAVAALSAGRQDGLRGRLCSRRRA